MVNSIKTAKRAKTTKTTKAVSKQAARDIALKNAPIKQILVQDLVLSPLNSRQTVDEAEITRLVRSILCVGLVQNLVGYVRGKQTEIVAGGCRLRALQRIIEEFDRPDFEVPVIIVATEEEARLIAGAENEVRLAPTPVEEITAYRASRDGGHAPEDIAKAFGVTTRHVKGRLKLADLAPCILDALEKKEITLDVAGAYTIAETQEEQIAVFEELKDSWSGSQSHTVHNRLKKDRIGCHDRLALFVTHEAYEKAGGTTTEDLFGDEVFYDDRELLNTLALEKIGKYESDLKDKGGWLWTEYTPNIDHEAIQKSFKRTLPTKKDLPKKEMDELAKLNNLRNSEVEMTDQQLERFDFLHNKLRTPHFSKAQKAVSGVIVSINYHGEFVTIEGLVKAGEVEAATKAKVLDLPKGEAKTVSDSALQAREGASKYSLLLQDDLGYIRTAAVQTAMLEDEDFAFDALVFSLSQPNLYAGQTPFGLSGTFARNHCSDEGLQENDVLRPEPRTVPIRQNQINDAFIQFRQLPKAEKMRLLTEHVARCTSIKLATAPQCDLDNTVFEMLDVNPRKVWTPTQSFFLRLKAAQLDAIVEHLNGKPPTATFVKMKKGEKVDYLHKLFTDQAFLKTMHKDMRKRVAEWLPEGLGNPKSNQEPEDKITSLKAA